jgi:hypothetical protein
VNFYLIQHTPTKEKNDPTAAIAYVKEGANFYILECVAEWLDFSGQIAFAKDLQPVTGTPRPPSSALSQRPQASPWCKS